VSQNTHESGHQASVLDGAILRNLTLVKLIKGMQVDTLVPQAMKDVQSCEKRRGAAKKR
jgi:hypothetical protein